MARTPAMRHMRHRHFSRTRHQEQLTAFLAAQGTRLTASVSETTVTPAHVSAAAAVGTLTFGANAGNGKVVTIGTRTYTMKTALTEAKASDVYTVGGGGSVIQDGNTLVLNGKTYTWQTVLTNVDGHVLIGANDTAALLNMLRAITLGAGSGTLYAAATTAHPTITATASNATTLTVQALLIGTAGNALTATESSPGSFASSTLLGGLAAVVDEVKIDGSTASNSLDNLIAAINAAAGAGSTYSTGTTAHAEVSAAAGAGDTVTITAVTAGNAGNFIGTTTDVVSATWGDTHLLTGVDESFGPTFTATTHGLANGEGPYVVTSSNGASHVPAGLDTTTLYWVAAVDANTLALAGSSVDAIAGNYVAITGVGTGTIKFKKPVTNDGMFELLRKMPAVELLGVADIDSINP